MARLPSPSVAKSTVQPARYWTEVAACGPQAKGPRQQMHLIILNVFHVFEKQVNARSCLWGWVPFCFVVVRDAANFL